MFRCSIFFLKKKTGLISTRYIRFVSMVKRTFQVASEQRAAVHYPTQQGCRNLTTAAHTRSTGIFRLTEVTHEPWSQHVISKPSTSTGKP